MGKRKSGKRKSKRYQVDVKASQGKEDVRQRKKYNKGKRIEAYTFGEALGKKGWP